MPRTPRYTGAFNVLLSEEEYGMLRALATENSTNMSIVLRQALRSRYRMQIERLPMCASGVPCLVPHVHAVPAPAPTPAPVNA